MAASGRLWRYTKRFVATLLLTVVVAVVLALILVHTDWGRDKIRAQIEAALRDEFPGGASVGKVEGSVLGELVVRDLVIDGMDRRPMVSVGELRVHVSIVPLLEKRVRVTSLELDRVDVAIRPQPPDPPKPPPSGGGAWSVELPDVRVAHGTFSVTGYGAPIHLADLTVNAAAAIPAGRPITARVVVGGTWNERAMPFWIAANGAAIDPDREVHLDSLSIAGGGATVVVTNVRLDPTSRDPLPSADLFAFAPSATVARLAPGVELPGDAMVLAHVEPATNGALIAHLDGRLGAAELHVLGWGDLRSRAAGGGVVVDAPDLAPITRGAIRGAGRLAIGGTSDGHAARGLVAVTQRLTDVPATDTLLAFDVTMAKAKVTSVTTGAGGLVVTAGAELHRAGRVITVAKADATVAVDNPEVASQGRVAAHGSLRATASIVSGTLAPVLDLRVSGRVAAGALALGNTYVSSADGYYAVRIGAAGKPLGSAHLEARGIAQAGAPLGAVVVDASNRSDDTLDVAIHAHPRPEVAIDLDAHVIPDGDTITVALGNHHARLPDARELTGRGGTIRITPGRIVATKIVTEHRGGQAEVGGTFDRATGALTATLDLRRLPVSLIDPRAQGDATGHVTIARANDRWKGEGTIAAIGVIVDDRLIVDSRVHVAIDGRRVALEVNTGLAPRASAQSSGLALGALHGSADVAIAVDAPAVLTDVAAWKRLTRKDLRAATVTLGTIDLGMLGATGQVDGTIILTPVDTHGTIQISGITTPAGAVTGTATFDNDQGEIVATTQAQVEGLGAAHLDARVGMPEHLFDPAAWQLQGEDAVRGASVRLERFTVDPALLAKLGIDAPYHGSARLELDVTRGIRSAKFTVDADGIAGGTIVKPLDLHAVAEMDATRSTGAIELFTATAKPRATDDATGKLLHAEATVPVTFDRWRASGYAAAKSAGLKGSFAIPSAKVADLLAIIGRKDVEAGTLDGSGTLGGTLQVPTATLAIAAHGVKVKPLVTGRAVPVLDELAIKGAWGGVGGSLDITGKESDGGTLAISASGTPTDLAAASGTIAIAKFDIAPIAAFAPGQLVTTTGLLSANVEVRGFDPARMQLRGDVSLTKGRIPIATLVGTLRDTTARLNLDGRRGNLSVTGKLGACNVDANHTCRTVELRAAGDALAIEATMKLSHVQPVTATQPIISGEIVAHLKRQPDHWGGDVRVSNASVTIPRSSGSEVLPSSAPVDMVFVDAITPIVRGPRKAPDRPWLVAEVTIDTTSVTSDEVRGAVHGQLEVSYGAGDLGMLGMIEAEQGVAEVFNHRYQLDHGNVTFDGTTDAQLDLRLIHDFPTMTLTADVTGRLSDPQLSLGSEPATYTEGQLLGFFLGGEPGGDPNTETRDAATAAGTSLLSQKIGRAANKVLPSQVKIDVFNCSVASTTTSAACTVGKWLTTKLFLAYKQHLEAKPGENAYEGQVEYYLRHDVVLEGNIGDAGYDGLDLLWRHRW